MKNKGITLISLVITIIILIILASITIYLSLGNNGIFKRANEARETTNKQEATDIINLKITTAQINKYAEKQEMPTLQELADALYEDNEIQYVALESKVADKERITVGNKTSIFTKLDNYPYEFEINSSLQLSSINGVKVASTKDKKEILWSSNETGIRNIELKKNIIEYDFLIVYYNVANNNGSLVFDTSTTYSMRANYNHNSSYAGGVIKMDIETNTISMTVDSNSTDWKRNSYMIKVVGVKL